MYLYFWGGAEYYYGLLLISYKKCIKEVSWEETTNFIPSYIHLVRLETYQKDVWTSELQRGKNNKGESTG